MSQSPGNGSSGRHHSTENQRSGEQENPTTTFSQTLSITIDKGDPVDSPSNRHTAFFIAYSDGRNVLSQVVGGSGFFEKDERWNIDPLKLSRWMIEVVTVQTNKSIRDILYNTPINNAERAWNCQSWVGDGLRRLQEAGVIAEGAVVEAADRMVDVLMEAPDED